MDSTAKINRIVESERRLREAEKMAKIGSWELDLVNNNLYWSDEIYRIFDATPQSFEANYEAFLGFIHPDDRDLVDDAFQYSIANHEPYGPLTHRLIMKNGSIKFVEERGQTDYDETGRPIRSYGICQDITERVIGEQTKALLKEKEILLKEIYHRVKNNLQLVSSLLHIQADKIKDSAIREIFESNRRRIAAIALVHDQLCRSNNLATVFANEYITSLIDSHKNSFITGKDEITFELELSNSTISIDKAVPFGLILNEVISNSIKHAFPLESGKISVQLTKSSTDWELIISDNGIGVESLAEMEGLNSFGMEIIRDLTSQLEGSMKIDGGPNKGIRFLFQFPA